MTPEPRRYADQIVDWLAESGYTHCFFVGGGNIMHLLDAVRTRMTCVPVVHEVAGCIAAEYFNEMSDEAKAFALVTAGPGLTNAVTAIAACWVESRELLVLGGQVKSSDLSRGTVRQVGHQEIDGRSICEPISKASVTMERPLPQSEFLELVRRSGQPRKGPVVVEVCLDVGAAPAVIDSGPAPTPGSYDLVQATEGDVERTAAGLLAANRPLLLIGGGVDWHTAASLWTDWDRIGLPVAATWNGTDRVPHDLTGYLGRPNTYGMRWSNVLIQQSDYVVAAGTRLGVQQTGFAVDQFAAAAALTQIDIDPHELAKPQPNTDYAICADANDFLRRLVARLLRMAPTTPSPWEPWLSFCREVQAALPVVEPANEGTLTDPFEFVQSLGADWLTGEDLIVPCSSGNTFNVVMQTLPVKRGQRVVTDKGSASMGYGLSGAIGAAMTEPRRRVVHFEGDGGFAQNLQELGTVAVQDLCIKSFLFANDGYASIRQMQRNYFGGEYLGCDRRTGVGLPDWAAIAAAYGVPTMTVGKGWQHSERFRELMAAPGPALFVVQVDPDQTHWPKITSRVDAEGAIFSNPLHRMTPELTADIAARVTPYLDESARR